MAKKLLAMAMVLLCGCATTPVSVKDAIPAPKDRVLYAGPTTTNQGAALTVIRDEGMIGSACYLGFWINGILAARVATAEMATFQVEPGELLLRVGWDPEGRGLCSFGKQDWIQRETLLRAGQKKVFRLSIDQNGKFDISPGDPM